MADDVATREQLEALLRLQSLDSTIRRLELRMSHLPEQAALDAVAEEAAAVRAEHDAGQVELEAATADTTKYEADVGLLTDRRNSERARMYGGEVSSPRELQAIRGEIDGLDRRITDLEEDLLAAMERRERVEAAVGVLTERRGELDGRGIELTAARDHAARDILDELEAATTAREAERGVVPADLLARYEASRERNTGVGVGQLDHGLCSACRMELTPMEVSELRNGPPLSTCPQCHRLIIVLE